LANLATDRPPAHPGHHDVEHDNVGKTLARKAPCFVAIVGIDDFEFRMFHRPQMAHDEF
jgi:hypothetical protein